jgi:hypothetical protein
MFFQPFIEVNLADDFVDELCATTLAFTALALRFSFAFAAFSFPALSFTTFTFGFGFAFAAFTLTAFAFGFSFIFATLSFATLALTTLALCMAGGKIVAGTQLVGLKRVFGGKSRCCDCCSNEKRRAYGCGCG